MSKELILSMTVSLDGFVCGPNKEFAWAFAAMSDEGRQLVAARFREVSLIGMGHGAYNEMAGFWPIAPGPIAAPMNEIPKVVFSRSGTIAPPNMEKATAAMADSEDPAALQAAIDSWLHPTVVGADLVADIQRLKEGDGKPICVIGGATFGPSLIATNLVDVVRISVHPVAIGRGIRLFGGLECPIRFKLEDLSQSKTGVVVKTYRTC